MPDAYTSNTSHQFDQRADRFLYLAIAAACVGVAAILFVLFYNSPDANAFNERFERIFVKAHNLRHIQRSHNLNFSLNLEALSEKRSCHIGWGLRYCLYFSVQSLSSRLAL